MASTSTNKQPLLVDRPFFSAVTLGEVGGVLDPMNYNSPDPAGLVSLVEGGPDGTLVESVTIASTQVDTDHQDVLLFMSTVSNALMVNNQNTHYITSETILSAVCGQTVQIPLPPAMVPVPNVGEEAKNTALYLPKNWTLFVGLSQALCNPSYTARVKVYAQGGHF
jgi:hypothetical protein